MSIADLTDKMLAVHRELTQVLEKQCALRARQSGLTHRIKQIQKALDAAEQAERLANEIGECDEC